MRWAIALDGDPISRLLKQTQPAIYRLVLEVKTKDSPKLEVYRRIHD
jgi:hypothetical protein